MVNRAVCFALNLFVFMLYIQVVSSQLPADQVSAMTSIYDIIQNDSGSSFVWSDDVLKNSNPCSWRGVACSNDNSFINSISFRSFSISAFEFLPFLCDISTLESIDVSNNQISSIPDGFYTACGEISGLKLLNFSGNDLSGSLPSFNGFTGLEYLDFSRNFLSGEISLQFDGLGSLKGLNLGWNIFSGNIPTNLGNMNVLEELVLSANLFIGEIPVEITKFKKLRVIDLSANKLSGSIPWELGQLTMLQTLVLSQNFLIGGIPTSLVNITTLQRFSAILNLFHGTIPPGITRHLSFLDLSYNWLTGTIPSDLLSGENLQALDLSSNKLEGPIPPITSTKLFRLRLGGNSLSGRIPSMPEKLQIGLNLSYNLFTGEVPKTLSRLYSLEVLDLSNNMFTGEIPSFLMGLSSLTHLLLKNNNLSGEIPQFRKYFVLEAGGNSLLIHPAQRSPSSPFSKKSRSIDSDNIMIAVASGMPVGLLISIILIFISRRYDSVHGHVSPANSIHRSIVDFKKGMKPVAEPQNIILKASFSTFYKAAMPSGTTYLVKKVNHSKEILHFPRYKELVEELEVYGSLSNANIMIPIAYVLTAHRAYLFYEFVRGTLSDFLHHKMGNRLNWGSRYTIAIGVARGLAFLHECKSGPIILLDLSSKSILLKSMDEPQISDIELCSLLHRSMRRDSISAVAGSIGYAPPEYASSKRVTAAGNVYSFGVVLLELITGKPAVSGGIELAKWVWSSSQQCEWNEILDSSVSDASVAVRNQMLAVLKVALACISTSPEERPNAITLLQMLLSARLSMETENQH